MTDNFARTPYGNLEAMYGMLDYSGKVVLDIGADEGTTARFFLSRGARHVHALEVNPELLVKLKEYARTDTRVTAEGGLESPEHAANLIHRVRPDITKVDCEGCESGLLDVPHSVLASVPEWLIETHSRALHAAIMTRFAEAGFDVTVVEEWDFNPEVKVISAKKQWHLTVDLVTLEEYVRKIQAGEPFQQANYGDGEWGCLLGHAGQNVNGEVYNPTLSALLRNTLTSPTGHWCGTNPGPKLKAEVDHWISQHRPSVRWVEKEVLSGANANGKFGPFLAAVRKRPRILVGPGYLMNKLDEVVGLHTFIRVRDSSAWERADEIAQRVADFATDQHVIMFSAGMASNLMIQKLAAWRPRLTVIDMGAIWDPYVGVLSRKAYRKPEWPERMAANLAGSPSC